MKGEDLGQLTAFLTVAREGGFTRAAAQLGASQSAVSQAVARLEARLGVRLLSRTTRSVSLTEAGERLQRSVGPAMDEIEEGLGALSALRDKPAGSIRLTATEHVAHAVLWPAIAPLLAAYPDIRVEVVVDNGLTDIVAGRLDAGVRLGEQVEKDMIAVPVGPPMRMALVAAPSYLAGRDPPRSPHDLAGHDCINLRLRTSGALYAWEFEKDGRELRVRVDGQLTVNSPELAARAAIAGAGLGFLLEDHVTQELADGRLVRLLPDWCPPFSGFHLYYPSRRQTSRAFALLVEALRHRG